MITGKNKRKHIAAFDNVHKVQLQLDSIEERDFLFWCCEAVELSIISDFEYQPKTFILSDAVKIQTCNNRLKSLFRQHVYTPDFSITFNGEKQKQLAIEFNISHEQISDCNIVYIDVKGTFNKNDGGRSFSINQKWVWQKFNIYINKLVPVVFFKKYGVPQKSVLTEKTKKPRKAFLNLISIKECFR